MKREASVVVVVAAMCLGSALPAAQDSKLDRPAGLDALAVSTAHGTVRGGIQGRVGASVELARSMKLRFP